VKIFVFWRSFPSQTYARKVIAAITDEVHAQKNTQNASKYLVNARFLNSI